MATYYDNASLVMIPSGYKDDKLYSIKPTDGSGDFTFSRDGAGASPATRVNASGYIEKGRENLLLQSNQFDTTWSLNNASVTSGQSGYDGSSDAWLLDITGGTATQRISQSVSLTGVQTFSLYAKAGTLNWLLLLSVGVDNPEVYFDLQNGVIGNTNDEIDSEILSVGGGWYKCSITHTDPTTQVRIYLATGNGNVTQSSGNIYIQDAQLEQGLVATDYIETTTAPVSAGLLGDMPRLDYSGGATCPSLLLEPSRVNLLPQSEYFGASWSASNITITSNATTSPEGVDNATLLANTSASNYLVYGASVSASTTYQFSFYAKNVDATAANVIFYDASNSAVISTTAYEGDLTTEWKRLDFSVTTPVGCTSLNINIVNGLAGSLYVYGAQFEAASYVSSYIPTYGSASTRGADVVTELTSVSSLIGQTEGTLFIHTDSFLSGVTSGNRKAYFYLSDGTFSNRIELSKRGGTTTGLADDIAIRISVGGVTQFDQTIAQDFSGELKVAFAYKNGDVAAYINGSSVYTNTGSVSIPATSEITIGNGYNEPLREPVKQALLFKTRLTNAELAALTTI